MTKTGVGFVFLGLSAVLTVVLIAVLFSGHATQENLIVVAILIAVFAVLGMYLAFNVLPFQHLQFNKTGIDITFVQVEEIKPRELPPDVKQRREEYARNNPPPAADAPEFSALTDVPDMAGIPGADAMVPMYLLDKNFRILDWNEAFSLAFDRTMEGRRGQSAIEWVYFLDNFKEALDHANRAFANLKKLPRFDKEELQFTSVRFQKLVATKRAYQLPDDAGNYAGWLIVLDLKFKDTETVEQYRLALVKALQRSLLWTEYALSYDQILTSLPSYEDLIRKILGEVGNLSPVPPGGKVLDLGAGTGNLARRLAGGNRLIFCVENNRTMLNLLQAKCRPHLRRDNLAPGIIALKQDVSSLFGLPKNYFDLVIANNVFYSLTDPAGALAEIAGLLKPGGEIRISGPAKGVDVGRLFQRFRKELASVGKFDALRTHFDHALYINSLLQNDLSKWAERDTGALFREADLTYLPQCDTSFYYGHGAIRAAKKR